MSEVGGKLPAASKAAPSQPELPPLALYVHFPWCVRKCPYCDFNSYTLHDELPETRYVEALLQDLESQLHDAGGQAAQLTQREIVSVFLGGGTPSLFSPEAIGGFLSKARGLLKFAADAEVTLEANPGTIERGRFAGYRAAGVSRVSLGAQSFDPRRLAALGRIHTADETRLAAAELHAAGLDNFNVDLMYALPEQTPAEALEDLRSALALQPAHLSHYHLTMEPGTVFAANPPQQPGDDSVEEMLRLCQRELTSDGFRQYEVSGYARAGRQCRHNLNYWQFGDYLGLGAGAHGKLSGYNKLSGSKALQILRTTQLREPRKYLAAVPAARAQQSVEPVQRPFEFMMNALRLLEGFAGHEYEARTGLALGLQQNKLEKLRSRGLLQTTEVGWRPSAMGLRFLNDLLLEFLPSKASGVSAQNRQL
jgi:oxygen-independent coproporphyrinogen-3 oxidase